MDVKKLELGLINKEIDLIATQEIFTIQKSPNSQKIIK